MNNLETLLSLFSKMQNKDGSQPQQNIPKEILDQYPYGDFPQRYTKAGQENLRKESENRFSYAQSYTDNTNDTPNSGNNINIMELLPLLLMSDKKEPQKMFKTLSKFLFKDNPELLNLLDLFSNSNIKSQELPAEESFPDTNKVSISSLKRID